MQAWQTRRRVLGAAYTEAAAAVEPRKSRSASWSERADGPYAAVRGCQTISYGVPRVAASAVVPVAVVVASEEAARLAWARPE